LGLDIKTQDMKTTFYDMLRMVGKLRIRSEDAVLRTVVEKDVIYGYKKDSWKHVPGKIMFGNGITLTTIISLNLRRNWRSDYLLEQMYRMGF